MTDHLGECLEMEQYVTVSKYTKVNLSTFESIKVDFL